MLSFASKKNYIMDLKLTKPIAFFDLETTGKNVAKDRIVEIAILKVQPDGKEEEKLWRVNPEIPICKEAQAIHGISDEDVKDEPTFKQLSNTIDSFLKGCDLAGYNSNKFDIPLLVEEFMRAGIDFDMKKRRFIDVQVIFFKMEPRTLSAAYQFYCNKTLEDAHSAAADTKATYEVLKSQLERYDKLENDMNYLADFTSQTNSADFAGRIVYNKKGVEVFNFGKHKGKVVEEVFEREPSYYNWMMKGDFPHYTKKIITAIKLRAFNKENVKHNS